MIEYLVSSATVIQNSVGATFSGNTITMPGGSAAVTPGDANALVLEWDARDLRDSLLGAVPKNGTPLLGSIRVLRESGFTVSDLAVGFYVRAVTGGHAMGGVIYYDEPSANRATYGSIWNQGGWSELSLDFPNTDGATVTWASARNATAPNSMSIVRTLNAIASERGPSGTGRIAVSGASTATRNSNGLFIRFDDTAEITLRAAIMRRTGSAGDIDLNPRFFSQLAWGGMG